MSCLVLLYPRRKKIQINLTSVKIKSKDLTKADLEFTPHRPPTNGRVAAIILKEYLEVYCEMNEYMGEHSSLENTDEQIKILL